MTIPVDEAASALKDAEAAAGRAASARGYHYASNYLMLWGVVWAASNVATQVSPRFGQAVWPIGALAGMAGSVWLGARQGVRHAQRAGRGELARNGWLKALVVGLAIGGFGAAVSAIAPAVSFGQSEALAGLAVGAIYMAMGAGVGFRLSAVGAGIMAATLVGWFFVRDYFFLWMAVAGGGGLLLGGLWFRKV